MAKELANVLEIEVDDPQNGNLHFAPLQSSVRSRFDAGRLLKHDDGAGKIAREWDQPIPGQRLRLNLDDNTASLIEPLHDDEHSGLREKITRKGFRLPQSQNFTGVDVSTWSFWMKRAIESGSARLISGSIPEKLPGKPRTSFITSANTEADPIDKLTAAFEKQNQTLEKLLSTLISKQN